MCINASGESTERIGCLNSPTPICFQGHPLDMYVTNEKFFDNARSNALSNQLVLSSWQLSECTKIYRFERHISDIFWEQSPQTPILRRGLGDPPVIHHKPPAWLLIAAGDCNVGSSSSCGLSCNGRCHSYERAPYLSILRSVIGSCQTNAEWYQIWFNGPELGVARLAWSKGSTVVHGRIGVTSDEWYGYYCDAANVVCCLFWLLLGRYIEATDEQFSAVHTKSAWNPSSW